MSDETESAMVGDRGLVRIWRDRDGHRLWSVSVRVGESLPEIDRAYEIARQTELRLAEDDPPRPVRK